MRVEKIKVSRCEGHVDRFRAVVPIRMECDGAICVAVQVRGRFLVLVVGAAILRSKLGPEVVGAGRIGDQIFAYAEMIAFVVSRD